MHKIVYNTEKNVDYVYLFSGQIFKKLIFLEILIVSIVMYSTEKKVFLFYRVFCQVLKNM
jgi:hypothetical protein